MVRSLYTACTGMVNETRRMDIITNNLANSATTGFKKEGVVSQSFDQMLTLKIQDASEAYARRPIGNMSLGVKIGQVYTDYGQGALRETGEKYELGIEGNGFFAIERRDTGEVMYTRDGDFTITKDGYMVTKDGDYLLDTSGGRIQIPNDGTLDISIDIDGQVLDGENYIATIGLTDFEDKDYLKKMGDNLYYPVEGAVMMDSDGIIRQGYLEQSNMNVISEMVEMITITRAYEANQKLIQTTDTMIEKAVNEVGRV